MNDITRVRLLEAARLTRSGNLAEATAIIRRALRSGPPNASPRDAPPPFPPKPGVFDVPPPMTGRRRSTPSEHADGAAPGKFLSGTFAGAAGSRPYRLYVPTGYQGQRVPLVVMLHGCTQSPEDFSLGTRMNEAAEAATCLVLYPGQIKTANAMKCWNWFESRDQMRDAGEPALLAEMTRVVPREYAIDATRIFAAGLSAGGAACAILAATYPDIFAAVGVHSGLPHGAAGNMQQAMQAMRQGAAGRPPAAGQRQVPTIVFHGDRDTTVNPDNGEAVAARALVGARCVARAEDGAVPGGRAYTRTLHADAHGDILVEHWLVHGMGHAWSGGGADGTYTDPLGPDATAEMLRFFREHPMPVRR